MYLGVSLGLQPDLTVDRDSSCTFVCSHILAFVLSLHTREKTVTCCPDKMVQKRKGRKRELKLYRNYLDPPKMLSVP